MKFFLFLIPVTLLALDKFEPTSEQVSRLTKTNIVICVQSADQSGAALASSIESELIKVGWVKSRTNSIAGTNTFSGVAIGLSNLQPNYDLAAKQNIKAAYLGIEQTLKEMGLSITNRGQVKNDLPPGSLIIVVGKQ